MKLFTFLLFLSIIIGCNSVQNPDSKSKDEIIVSDNRTMEKVLPPSKKDPNYEKLMALPEGSRFLIQIDGDDQIKVSKEIINLDELKIDLKNFIAENNPNYLIGLNLKNGTSYSIYMKVKDVIKSVYEDLKMDYSKQKFKKNYDDLSEEESKIVNDSVPEYIIEFEPTK